MGLFSIDREKCKRDGICVDVCPVGVIETVGEDAFPSQTEDAEEFCTHCGHCVVACPHQAFTLRSMSIEQCIPRQEALLPTPEQIREFLTSRRSVRRWKRKPVGRELLEQLIDVARCAPSGNNTQPVLWTVVEGEAEVQNLAALSIEAVKLSLRQDPDQPMAGRWQRVISAWARGDDRILRAAPAVVAVHCQADLQSAHSNLVIALTYLELYAASKGLGTCWAGYLIRTANTYRPLAEALGIPRAHQCFGAVMLGYPKYDYARIPKRNPAKVSWR